MGGGGIGVAVGGGANQIGRKKGRGGIGVAVGWGGHRCHDGGRGPKTEIANLGGRTEAEGRTNLEVGANNGKREGPSRRVGANKGGKGVT
ncbi:hypothetical protein TIFTF001_029708 [Ficus carica]|uniref:Uncharacterized protein n=1 Tax=Ficus carica TaxID=3494 RepID=A0AA88DRY9_FICCA|nr:hypothetical protein TIFTF001_029708 [Ficus carica]